MKKGVIILLLLVGSLWGWGCQAHDQSDQGKVNVNTAPPITIETSALTYVNTQYGFTFRLPASWQNYSIVTTSWQGIAISGKASGQVAETGPIISIRHPQWSAAVPRQDIPIMVFTIDQWNALQRTEFSVGAAPIPPSELGRNSRYVLVLPARYNYAFPAGFEEVEVILAARPLLPLEN
jgi:hypothetical protein